MREILFRGKRRNANKWIMGGFYSYGNKSAIVATEQYIPDTRDWDTVEYYENNPVYKPVHVDVDPNTVSQWTGLVDKNGIKIFEGDIVRASWGYVGVVDYELFMYSKHECTISDDIEVIGNIWDNPELGEE